MFDAADFNQVIIVGASAQVERAMGLLRRLDTDTGVVTKFYKLKHVQPDRIDTLIKGLLDPKDIGRGYTSTPDNDGNLLIVRATTEVHQRIVEFLQTLVFIVVIASLVQLVEIILQKLSAKLYDSLGIFLPLITTNCAVLGCVVLNAKSAPESIQSTWYGATIYGFCSALGLDAFLAGHNLENLASRA